MMVCNGIIAMYNYRTHVSVLAHGWIDRIW